MSLFKRVFHRIHYINSCGGGECLEFSVYQIMIIEFSLEYKVPMR